MNTYLITYDLHTPGQKYNCLYKLLSQLFGQYWDCMNNIAIVKSNMTAQQIHNSLQVCLDGNDKLLVLKIEKGPNSDGHISGTEQVCVDWLKTALS